MAKITLATVWINAKGDGSWSEAFRFSKSASLTRVSAGNVSYLMLDDGGTVATIRPGVRVTWQLAAPACTLDEVDWLEDHVATELCFRDHRGQKIFGVYAQLDETVMRADRSSVSLQITKTG